MEQIIYEQSPYIPTAYPESVEAYNYSGWQGWSTTPGKGGGVFFTSPVMASYLTVHPATAAAAAAAQSSSKGLLIAVVVVIVVVIVIVALVVALRGRKRQVEEIVIGPPPRRAGPRVTRASQGAPDVVGRATRRSG